MKRKRFTEEQIGFALRRVESGAPVAEVDPPYRPFGDTVIHGRRSARCVSIVSQPPRRQSETSSNPVRTQCASPITTVY